MKTRTKNTTVLFVAFAAVMFASISQPAFAGSIIGWGDQVVGVDLSGGFVKVAAGWGHSLGLKQDGSIVTWGANYTIPLPNSGFIDIAAGSYHSLGLKNDGSIVAWGWNDYGQCNVPSPNSGFIAITASEFHSLGLKKDGSIVAWGNNDCGQCNVPSPNSGFTAIAAGGQYSLGLKQDGSIVAWGSNNYGQCKIPSPNSGFIAIAAGGFHSLGLKQDGSIVAWGNNDYGQRNIPSPNNGFIAIAAGDYHSLGLKQDGSIVVWGNNDFGQYIIPSPNSSFVAIAAGDVHNLGLKNDGSIVAWGRNYEGQCNIPSPNSGFSAIAAGWYHSLGLKQDGSIVAWGYNNGGQCNVPSPNSAFTAISAGYYHSLGLKQDGSIVAWGSNYDEYGHYAGQCNIPSPNSGFIAIAAGGFYSLGLKQDDSIVAWGWNDHGQCNVPSPNSGFIAIAAGYWHSLGLKQDGSIVAWGYNDFGQCNVPSPNSGFIAIAAGYLHSLGLKKDGSIVAWGYNDFGQCNVPSPNSGFIAIATGHYHSLALKQDGSIVAWGAGQAGQYRWPHCGQCNIPSPNTRFSAIAAGGYHSLAIVNTTPVADAHQWKLDEKSGTTAYDSVGNSNGTFNGTDPCWIDGLIDGAIDCNGVRDYFSVSSLDNAYNPQSTFTVAGWFKTSQSTGMQTIVGQWTNFKTPYPSTYFGWQVLVEKKKVVARFGQASPYPSDITGTSDVNNGNWHHFAFVYPTSSSNAVLYVDGQSQGTPGKKSFYANDTKFRIGDGSYAYAPFGGTPVLKGGPFHGAIDDIMIFRRALTANEVGLLCQYKLGGKAFNPNPADGATGVDPNTLLSWSPGKNTLSHNVYLGTDFDDVNNATPDSNKYMGNYSVNTFDPCGLDLDTTYYWRIDEKNPCGIMKGDLWSFTTRLVDSNFIGWWKLDEGSGTIAYDSAGDNNGTLVNGPLWTTGQTGGALSFDGVNDYVKTLNNIFTDAQLAAGATLTAWLKTGSSSYGIIADDEGYLVLGVNYPTHPNKLLATADGGEDIYYSSSNVNDNLWHHAAIVWDGTNTAILYLDGVSVSSWPSGPPTPDLKNRPFTIGVHSSIMAYLNGTIDDVRVYDRALSAEEIQQLYQQTASGLIAHWKFDEGSGTIAHDSAGANDGTLVNGPIWTTGQIDGALGFDGVNDYVDLGNSSSLKPPLPLTVSTWVKLNTLGISHQLLDLDNQSSKYYGIWFFVRSDNTVEISYGSGGNIGPSSRRTKIGTTTLASDKWYHVAAVLRGPTNMTLYINSVDDGGTYSGTGGNLTYSTGTSFIGCNHSFTSNLSGVMDDMRIYNRALSADEVYELYENGL